jgi:ADP-ribosylation factor-binding protein GGA
MCVCVQVLESVVKACGLPVHQIVGKFRFLNELIKMVSPKYYANTPQTVKNRIYAMFTQWNFSLVDQPKVRCAPHASPHHSSPFQRPHVG